MGESADAGVVVVVSSSYVVVVVLLSPGRAAIAVWISLLQGGTSANAQGLFAAQHKQSGGR